MADVFISYSRKDRSFVEGLASALREQGRDVWVDLEDIPPTAEWLAEIMAGIDGSGAVIFVLSPDSVASPICQQEVAHAVAHSKRIVPALCRELDGAAPPAELAARNWILARATDDRDAALRALAQALDTDLDWVRAHTRLLTRALEWEGRQRDASFLLHGSDLREAERWLGEVGAEREPRPTALQTQYVIASRGAASRRQRVTLGGVSLALVLAAGLAVFAFLQRNDAVAQRDVALTEANARATAQAVAEQQRQVADQQRQRAERRFNDVRQLANSFLFDFYDAIRDLPGAIPVRRQVVAAAQQYLESLAQQAGSDAGLERELAASYLKLGDLQGNPEGQSLGDTAGALASYRKAQAIDERLLQADPGDSQSQQNLQTVRARVQKLGGQGGG